MDRFEWTNAALESDENLIVQQSGVRIYDGETKTKFDYGNLSLTTHRLLWRDHSDPTCKLSLSLSLIIRLEEQPSGFAKSAKILVHLSRAGASKPAGPVTSSPENYIRLSFRESGEREFFRCFTEAVKRKQWEHSRPPVPSGVTQVFELLERLLYCISETRENPGLLDMLQPHIPKDAATIYVTRFCQGRRAGPGIVGIERSIQRKQQATDKNISQAFVDLNNLIEKAKEMVNLSKTIATKIRDHQGDITEDETVKFKSYLLSMGIPDPVTRETHGTGARYYSELAREVSALLEAPLKECGGIMTLTDAYCRINRARGMELLSPEDLLNACEMLEILKTPVRLRLFDSGVMVLQLQSHSDEEIIKQTSAAVDEKGSLTAEELSSLVGLSVILAKERLLSTEKAGGVCRDETVEGLRFYPNQFLTRAA